MAAFILAPNEKIVKHLRRSGASLLPALVLTILAIVVPWKYLQGLALPGVISLIWKIWLLGWVFWLVWKVLSWRLERYVITNRRLIAIIHEKPAERLVEETPLSRILNISLEKKGFLDLFLGLGTVLVHAVGLEEPLRLRHVNHATRVVRYLWQENQKALESKDANLPDNLLQTRKEQRLD